MSLLVQQHKYDTLLIVDDDEINRLFLENMFESTYAIEHAENGKIGLERILQNPAKYSAILLDVIMPEMDGIEVLQRLKEKSLLEKIPVFLITSEVRDEITREAYNLGVMDVIQKPVTGFIVRRRVNSIVELFHARKILSGQVKTQQEELLQQAQKLVHMSEGMIESLATAIEFRSGESGAHVRRIHDITRYLLQNTVLGKGLSQIDIDNIALASIMHDVGKISIPDAILNKKGRLTPEEFELIKEHTTKGASLLEKIPQLREHEAYSYAWDIAMHHHERWDGRGYPEGLKGDQISIWSQVVSLADVYDALVSERCYKPPFSREEAKSMILANKCGVFNPLLLENFINAEDELAKLYIPERQETKNGSECERNSG